MKHYTGNTPMADITYKYNGKIGHVYAKLEYYNPTGSIKDRIVEYIINKATETEELKEGQAIIETTSGNTGIGIAAYGALTKHPVHIFMPTWASEERIKLMKIYGANVHLVNQDDGGFFGCLDKTVALAKELNGFRFNQFASKDNLMAHYNSTGVEILKQLPDVTDFISGVGSGGTIMGIGSRLKEANNANIIAIEPDCAQILRGKKATRLHKIEGIGDDIIPEIYDAKIVSNILSINDDDAVAMASMLAKKLGLGVGISSGANFIGAVLSNIHDNQKIATVFSDDNKKYLSTTLADSPEPKDGMVSAQIELLDFEQF